ncbi:MAG: ATPase, T2SS/T4P/T4SS family [Firmicutes bacterium]|nr:ATPase, T2SS/T4P/T4SS family [Bacillota bacterium]
MKCAWKELLSILPPWLAAEVERRDMLQELRLRLDSPPELVFPEESQWLRRAVSRADLLFCVNTASRYSPWTAQTMANGYLTAPGGHRIGLCGETVVNRGVMTGFREITSLCIRVARDFPGIGENAAGLSGSILLIGPPGSGKTTLLRDIVRTISQRETVAVVDEREELFPVEFRQSAKRMDVLTGCAKADGIEIALRCMGPSSLAVDEITAEADCEALLRAGWCGVRLLATAHAASLQDLYRRAVYRPLVKAQLFSHVLVLHRDKSWREERMEL